VIAFFDYPDVFEDFYPHYGIDQKVFATRWADSGNHAFLSLLQREVGDVVWYVFSLAPELSGSRHEVVGCQVKILPSSLIHRLLWRAFYLPQSSWRWRCTYPAYATVASYVALASRPFIRTLLHDRPDFLFVQDYASGRFDTLFLIARVLGVPLIAYHAGSRPEGYVGRIAKRWTIRRADKLIVSSRNELEMLAKNYHVSTDRLVVILTPIDTETFRPQDRDLACRAIEVDPSRRYLLFVGRLDDRVKQISVLIQAFSELAGNYRDFDLIIVGEGPDGPRLMKLAEERASGRVRFFGWISGGASLVPFYNVAECLVLPSLSEGFPTVVGEAMACGRPVVASGVGGVGELILEGCTGWTFPPGDGDLLAARLAIVMTNSELVASMGSQARRQAERRVSHRVVASALRKCFSMNGS
jgi:glycosyltransferase involved in cell wall biosynthesis